MNGKNLLADSNIVINFLNGDEKYLTVLKKNTIFLSIISVIEICSVNLGKDEIENLKKFLYSHFEIIYINDDIAVITSEIRRNFKLKTPDAVIAATAKLGDLQLMTEDIEIIKKLKSEITFYK